MKTDLQNLETQSSLLELNSFEETDGNTLRNQTVFPLLHKKTANEGEESDKEVNKKSDKGKQKGEISEVEHVENGPDSDLESGVSSMESFEGLLKKVPYSTEDDSGSLDRGVEQRLNDQTTIDQDGGISISPDEYERFRKNQSVKSKDLEVTSEEKQVCVDIPLLMVTDENGDLAEIRTSDLLENTNSSLLSNINEGFEQREISDKQNDKTPLDSGIYSVDVTDEGKLQVEPVYESNEDALVENESTSENSRNVTSNEPHEEHGIHELLFDDFDLYGKQKLPKLREVTGDENCSSGDDSNASQRQDMSHYTIVSNIDAEIGEEQNTGDLLDQTMRDSDKGNGDKDMPVAKTNVIFHYQGESALSDSVVQNGSGISIDQTFSQPRTNIFSEDPKIAVVTSCDLSVTELVSESPKRTLSNETENLDSNDKLETKTSEQALISNEPAEKVQKLDATDSKLFETRTSMLDTNPLVHATTSILNPQEILISCNENVTMSVPSLYSSSSLGAPVTSLTRTIASDSLSSVIEEDEEPLSENLTLDEFVIELDKLLEKLRTIEDMMTSEITVDEDIKDELSKHVVGYIDTPLMPLSKIRYCVYVFI